MTSNTASLLLIIAGLSALAALIAAVLTGHSRHPGRLNRLTVTATGVLGRSRQDAPTAHRALSGSTGWTAAPDRDADRVRGELGLIASHQA